MIEAVLEFVARLILSFVLLVVLLPVILIFAGPFILLGSVFASGSYWSNVKKAFQAAAQKWLDWGWYVFP
jgi:hypothetical protein